MGMIALGCLQAGPPLPVLLGLDTQNHDSRWTYCVTGMETILEVFAEKVCICNQRDLCIEIYGHRWQERDSGSDDEASQGEGDVEEEGTIISAGTERQMEPLTCRLPACHP